MSDLPDIKDSAIAGAPRRWGVPWHGRIEGGVLYTGKNDSFGHEITRTWIQPPGGGNWLIGGELPDPYAAPAGASADVIAQYAAEKAADASRGMELTNYALLSGIAKCVHGKSIDGMAAWIYCPSDGSGCWKVELLNSSFSMQTSTFWSIKFTRFGDIKEGGGTPETVTKTGSVARLCSSTLTDGDGDTIFSCESYLSDVKSDGSKATVGVASTVADKHGTADELANWNNKYLINPLGFLEVTVSGSNLADLSASVELVSTAEDALGWPCIRNSIQHLYGDFGAWQQLEYVRKFAAWYDADGVLQYLEAHVRNEITVGCRSIGGGVCIDTFDYIESTVLSFGTDEISHTNHHYEEGGEFACGLIDCEGWGSPTEFVTLQEMYWYYQTIWSGFDWTSLWFYSPTLVAAWNQTVVWTVIAEGASADDRTAFIMHKLGHDEALFTSPEPNVWRDSTHGSINAHDGTLAFSSTSAMNFT